MDILWILQPVAMVTWGCFFSSNHLNWTIAQNWIKKNAIQAPASHVYWNGDFREGLLDPASVVTDLKDTLLCPTENIVSSLVNSFASELGFKVHSAMDIQSVD